ncbi:4352_t:CDS:2, partial [Acaulospora morrowiae]
MTRNAHSFTSQERREADAARKRRNRAMETLHKFALKFSEDTDLPTESPEMCCSNGKVVLMEPTIPPLLYHLFTSQDDIAKNFHDKIRFYNSAFTFASVGIRFDRELTNAKNGIYTFCVQGSFYHRIGSLLPEARSNPHYLQMYIYDTQHELHHRTNAIPNSNLNPAIVEDIKAILDEVNPYSINFRYISNFPEEDIKNLSMLIHTNIPGLDQRTHNVPTAPQVAAIWINDDVPPGAIQKRDILLRTRINQLIHISKFSGCYDPLAYPLLFPHGEQGWIPQQIPYRNVPLPKTININEYPNSRDSDDLIYENSNTSTTRHRKFVSAMEYYAYRIQIRLRSTNILLHAGRLFQQYVVD